jgi:hypothetical protein
MEGDDEVWLGTTQSRFDWGRSEGTVLRRSLDEINRLGTAAWGLFLSLGKPDAFLGPIMLLATRSSFVTLSQAG